MDTNRETKIENISPKQFVESGESGRASLSRQSVPRRFGSDTPDRVGEEPLPLVSQGVNEVVEKDLHQLMREFSRALQQVLAQGIEKRQPLGFRQGPSEDQGGSGFDGRPFMVALHEVSRQLEDETLNPASPHFGSEQLAHLAIQLSVVRQVTSEAFDGYGFHEGRVDEFARTLLDCSAVLTAVSVELQARLVSERLQAELEVAPGNGDGSRVLTIREGSILYHELERQGELREELLPGIQRSVGKIVHSLIGYIGELQKHSTTSIGFSLLPAGSDASLERSKIVENLDFGVRQLQLFMRHVDAPGMVNMNYRAALHDLWYGIMELRLVVLREVAGEKIGEGEASYLQSECEKTLRTLTRGIKHITEISYMNLGTMLSAA